MELFFRTLWPDPLREMPYVLSEAAFDKIVLFCEAAKRMPLPSLDRELLTSLLSLEPFRYTPARSLLLQLLFARRFLSDCLRLMPSLHPLKRLSVRLLPDDSERSRPLMYDPENWFATRLLWPDLDRVIPKLVPEKLFISIRLLFEDVISMPWEVENLQLLTEFSDESFIWMPLSPSKVSFRIVFLEPTKLIPRLASILLSRTVLLVP